MTRSGEAVRIPRAGTEVEGVTAELAIHEDPVQAFRDGWERARTTAPPGFDIAQSTLATCSPERAPSARVILLRGITSRGFQFFTNYGSRKARELDANPAASLCFFWFWLDEQVRIEGTVERVSPEESDVYFATRPRGSQIGAWASQQSETLQSRAELERRYHELDAEFAGRPVPRPPFWGGYTLLPARIEFWRAGDYRLHDRVVYERQGSGWSARRLYP
jgi:pyridoxamine 5'-phosphate oxidase